MDEQPAFVLQVIEACEQERSIIEAKRNMQQIAEVERGAKS
jgi:hypothetical protein